MQCLVKKVTKLLLCDQLTVNPNHAVILSLSIVLRSIKKLINLDLGGTLEGLLSARVPQNQPRRVNFRVHLEVHEGP